MTKGILFDLDGTLWDSTHAIVPAWNRALESLGFSERITHASLCACMGMTMAQLTATILPDRSPAERQRAWDACIAAEEAALRQTGGILYPRLRETLVLLRRSGWRLAVVSNCQKGYVPVFLDAHGLWDLFDDYEEHGRTGLDKAGNIRLTAARLGLDRALYLGDTEGDRAAAQGAGVPFLWAAWGFGAPAVPGPAIRDLSELPAAAEALLG